MIRILYIGYSLEPSRGGIERVTDTLATYLRGSGYEVFGCYDRQNEMSGDIRHKYADVLALSYDERHTESAVQALLRFVQCHKIDIIIDQIPQNAIVLGILERVKILASIHIICCLHTLPEYLGLEATMILNPLLHKGLASRLKLAVKKILHPFTIRRKLCRLKTVYRRGYALCDQYVLLSETFVRPFSAYAGLKKPSKLSVIPNPLTYKGIQVDFGDKQPYVMIAARLCLEKRIDIAMYAWSEVESALPADNPWRLKVVGGGYMLPYLEALAARLRLEKIDFEGHSTTPEAYYRGGQIYLMTSLYEGFGLSLTESGQFGQVVVAMDSFTTLHDIITDQSNGFIVPNNDYHAMANAIKLLIEQPGLRRQMAENAIVSCNRKFGIDRIADQWSDLFHRIIIHGK